MVGNWTEIQHVLSKAMFASFTLTKREDVRMTDLTFHWCFRNLWCFWPKIKKLNKFKSPPTKNQKQSVLHLTTQAFQCEQHAVWTACMANASQSAIGKYVRWKHYQSAVFSIMTIHWFEFCSFHQLSKETVEKDIWLQVLGFCRKTVLYRETWTAPKSVTGHL